jgi:hypothetical protein
MPSTFGRDVDGSGEPSVARLGTMRVAGDSAITRSCQLGSLGDKDHSERAVREKESRRPAGEEN